MSFARMLGRAAVTWGADEGRVLDLEVKDWRPHAADAVRGGAFTDPGVSRFPVEEGREGETQLVLEPRYDLVDKHAGQMVDMGRQLHPARDLVPAAGEEPGLDVGLGLAAAGEREAGVWRAVLARAGAAPGVDMGRMRGRGDDPGDVLEPRGLDLEVRYSAVDARGGAGVGMSRALGRDAPGDAGRAGADEGGVLQLEPTDGASSK